MAQETCAQGSTAPSERAQKARARIKTARQNATRIHAELERALDGEAMVNFVASGALRPLALDLLHSLSMDYWRPPKGAREFLDVYAMLIYHWRDPATRRRYSGVHMSAEQIARMVGCSERQWTRGTRLKPNGTPLVRGGAREWLLHHELIAVLPTTEVNRPGWRSRAGASLPWREGPYVYLPGRALIELLAMRERRIERASRRRKNLRSKGSGSSFRKELPSYPARARGRTLPIVQQCQRVAPGVVGVSAQTPRRASATPAPAEDGRHGACSTLSGIGSQPESEGHEVAGSRTAGDSPETARQDARPPERSAIANPEGAPPSPASDASRAILARPADLVHELARLMFDRPAFLARLAELGLADDVVDDGAKVGAPAPACDRENTDRVIRYATEDAGTPASTARARTGAPVTRVGDVVAGLKLQRRGDRTLREQERAEAADRRRQFHDERNQTRRARRAEERDDDDGC